MFTLTDSTKRTLRTAYHGLVALVTLLPVLATFLHGTPAEGQLTILVGWTATVSRLINLLEDKGLIPAFLRDVPAPGTVDLAASAAADATPATPDAPPVDAASTATDEPGDTEDLVDPTADPTLTS